MTPKQLNHQLIPWLLQCNAERPHWALKLKSPVQSLLKRLPLTVQFMVAQYTPAEATLDVSAKPGATTSPRVIEQTGGRNLDDTITADGEVAVESGVTGDVDNLAA